MIERTKLDRVLHAIEAQRGPFVLASLFMREDAPGRWDLVVSAPWLQRGKLVALDDFVKRLSDALGQEEVLSLSRVVTLNRKDPALKRILQELGSITQPSRRSVTTSSGSQSSMRMSFVRMGGRHLTSAAGRPRAGRAGGWIRYPASLCPA
jgi:hypothetical protein